MADDDAGPFPPGTFGEGNELLERAANYLSGVANCPVTPCAFPLTVTVTDGGGLTATFAHTVRVQDVNEAPAWKATALASPHGALGAAAGGSAGASAAAAAAAPPPAASRRGSSHCDTPVDSQ